MSARSDCCSCGRRSRDCRRETRLSYRAAVVTVVDVAAVVDELGAGDPRFTSTVSTPFTVRMLTGYCASRVAEIGRPSHSQWSNFHNAVQPEGCSTLYATMLSF